MKILFAYVPFMFRHSGYFEKSKIFDFENLYTDPRGLTGSEISCFTYADNMSRLGHDVSIITTVKNPKYEYWKGVRIIPFRDINDIGVLGGDWDVVYSWNELDALRFATHPKTLRVLNLQINDFNHGSPDFDNFIDVYTSPSHSHMQVMSEKTPDKSKWEVVFNGCYPDSYDRSVPKVDGRVIYVSSPDRGLHWLLQIWPKILKAVPFAELKIFYGVHDWVRDLADNPHPHRDIQTLSSRARYVREALKRLNNHRINVVGAVSRERVKKEFQEAQVLAYPCDTIAYTEGFSVTLMEACASGTIPVTTDVDALGEIYGNAVPMVKSPMKNSVGEYTDLVIKALTDKSFRDNTLEQTMKLSHLYNWETLTNNLVKMFAKRGRS